ncbi:serine/threonine-protein kinase Nek1-like isoform X2 [Patiria miniata]|uniref:non-specific serine/threonine protein kinase n=1 Tax=Patiria miniata TaxID=46514 RepID=A0A914A0K5_PATMI|nr:serine/threonine-protein kinase Nek1-like isoform X2 [Patiria miniata]
MNKYSKKKKIGEGSFGKALLVVHKETGKEYVIKEINVSKMKRKEKEESKKEVAVLRKMKHPNIVSYQDSFEELGNLYIVMDFCDGGDLYKAINGRRGVLFPEDQVLDWFVQICLAIKHVHDRKILHRDIKSQNIFLTKKGIVKLGDFGIARVLNSTVELARTCIGTPYYLSPEICENKPYNNKSDIWALGCVLYEICTLKHAFEAGNMKNLVLKIIRGSYPPVSPRYSYDLRNLIALLFKRNARDRPSVNTVLKKPFVQRRIEKFLSDTEMVDEFSHTVLHRNQAAGPYGAAGRPALAAERRPQQPVRLSDPAAKYGPSVGMRKPPAAGRKPAEKRKEPSQPQRPAVDLEKLRRERIEKERARQAREKQSPMNQQKLVDKQRMHHINKAREAGWRHTLSSGSGGSNGIENDGQSNDEPPIKEPRIDPEKAKPEIKPFKPLQERGNYDNYHKYLDNLRGKAQGAGVGQGGAAMFRRDEGRRAWPDEAAIRQNIRDRPVSASAAEAARRGEMARNAGAEAAGRAKLVEEFLSNKRAAAANKARVSHPLGAPGPRPAYNQPAPSVAPFAGNVNGRNQQEGEYLDRLKAIRMQNFQERRNIQQKVAGGEGKAVKASLESEIRRKKIEALKAQADEKAAKLKEQLERQRREAYEKEKKSWEEHIAKKKAQEMKRPAAVPVKGPAAAVVPLTAVLKDVGYDLMPTESPELKDEAVSKPAVPEKEQGGDRKKWGDGGVINLGNLPLQETASAMEATGAGDVVMVNTAAPPRGGGGGGGLGGGGKGAFGPPPPLPQGRKKWGGPAQTALNVLQQAEIVQGTTTLSGAEQTGGVRMGVTIVKDEVSPRKLPIAKGTITIADGGKKGNDDIDAGSIETIETKDTQSKLGPDQAVSDVPSKPRTAWDKSPSSVPKSPATTPTTPTTPKQDSEQTLKAPSSPLKPASPGSSTSLDKLPSPDKTSSPEKGSSPEKTSSPTNSASPAKTSTPEKAGPEKTPSPVKMASPSKLPSPIKVSSSTDKMKDETDAKTEKMTPKQEKYDDMSQVTPSSQDTPESKNTTPMEDSFTPIKQSVPPSTEFCTPTTQSVGTAISSQTQIPKIKESDGQPETQILNPNQTQQTQYVQTDIFGEQTPKPNQSERNISETKHSPTKLNIPDSKDLDMTSLVEDIDSPDDIITLDEPTRDPLQPKDIPSKPKLSPEAPSFPGYDAWGTSQPKQDLFPEALVSRVELESDDDDEDGEQDQSLYQTANRSDVLEGLETGNFDTDAKILRTCSMPDLSKLFRTTLALNPFFEIEKQTMEIAARTLELEYLQVRDVEDDEDDDEDTTEDSEDVNADDAGDEADGDDDDDEEYRSLVESMKSILEAKDAEDSARTVDEEGQGSPGGSDERSSQSASPIGAEGGEDEDDMADGNESGESKPINEDWDSGDGTDGEEDRDGESLFSRLEESRLQLEKELGCETFIKAYKSIQAIHEDEDEDIEQGTKVIGSILGKEQEHLYTKILQLVMADGAYTEDND